MSNHQHTTHPLYAFLTTTEPHHIHPNRSNTSHPISEDNHPTNPNPIETSKDQSHRDLISVLNTVRSHTAQVKFHTHPLFSWYVAK